MESAIWMLGAAVPAFLISFVVVGILRRFAPRLGLLDRPNARKVHSSPIPLGGGIGIWAGMVFPLLTLSLGVVWCLWDAEGNAWLPERIAVHLPGAAARVDVLLLVLGAATVLMLLGLWDDRRGLNWKPRLAIQFLVAAVCVASPELRLTAFIAIPGIAAVVTVVWIVAMINAFNMLDNMDGLSGGIGAIVGTLLIAVMLLGTDPTTGMRELFVAGFAAVLVGALLGFLFHNRPPARIFMGDAGSYLIGFSLSIATLLGTYADYQQRPLAILTPLFLMAVPMYDMVTVIAIRLSQGRSPFEADRNHLSHRLVDLGFTKPQAVATIHLLTATCGLGALLLHRLDEVGVAIVTLMVLCVLALIGLIEWTARRRLREQEAMAAAKVQSSVKES